jgi:hypothetical protein
VWTKYGDPSLYDNGEADLTWFQSIKKKFNNFVKDHSMFDFFFVLLGNPTLLATVGQSFRTTKLIIFKLHVLLLDGLLRSQYSMWIRYPKWPPPPENVF